MSDDTQMTLYTLEALMRKANSDEEIIQNITDAYLVWMSFQTGKNVTVEYIYRTSKLPELNQRRGPGNICLSALASINRGKEVVNDSKGCGGIMKVAPVGIYGYLKEWALEHTAKIAGKIAEITHKHPLSTYASAACTVLIQLCLMEEKMSKFCLQNNITFYFRNLRKSKIYLLFLNNRTGPIQNFKYFKM